MRLRSRGSVGSAPFVQLLVAAVVAAGALVSAPSVPTASASTAEYVVQRGETLTRIAERHGTTIAELQRLNGLRGSRILVGQRLVVPAPERDLPEVHVVRAGDTLMAISRLTGTSVRELRELNGLRDDRIFVGQKVRVRAAAGAETPAVRREIHVVERGDALWEIARAYDVSVDQLRAWNGLKSDRIHPGQRLVVHGDPDPPTSTYVVRRGDSLGEIALLHQMNLDELRSLNGIRGSVIHPGQRLKVRPLLGDDDSGLGLLAPDEIDWAALLPADATFGRIEAANGPYFHQQPRAVAQSSRRHLEEPGEGPWRTYQRARALWQDFERRVDRAGRLSRTLEGWTVVLDPGHGGIDPGAIVQTETGNGASVYVVEDEYVYDVALRIYVLLTLHGADVHLTLLAPNHLLRSNEPPIATFVHERNEVFDSERINRTNRASAWPSGSAHALAMRREIAQERFAGARAGRTVFISLHADNSPNSADAMTVFYQQNGRHVDRKSREFAHFLLPSLGADSSTRARNLAVLRNNTADRAVLIEVRNLAYASQAWMLRYEKQRQRDAEKIVRGLLEWAERDGASSAVASRGTR